MNHQPKRILVVEIKTLDNPGFDSSQLSTIKFFETTDKYQVDLNYKQIGSAIIDADDLDTNDPQLDKAPARRRRRRRKSN